MGKKLRPKLEVLSPSGFCRALGAARAGRSQMGGGRVGPETTMKMRIIIIIMIVRIIMIIMMRIIMIMIMKIIMIMTHEDVYDDEDHGV